MKRTERPWPENVMPTAEQWLDWLLSLDREAQMAQAEMVMRNSEVASRCLIGNHEGFLYELNLAREHAAAEYTRGVNEAAQAIRDGLREEWKP